MPGSQMLSAPDAAAAASMHPTACTILQQPQPIMQQQQTIIQQQPLQVTQPIYGGGMLAGQQLLEALPVSCALPASCPMPMPAMMPQSQPPEQRSIFFAGVTPVIPAETLLALFSQFGPVQSINLFKPWAGSKTSKGCGIVVFVERHSAAAALDALNGNFQWPGARSPMVVEWMDSNKQHKKARAQPLSFAMMQQQPQQQHYITMQPRPNAGLMMPGQLCIHSNGQQQLLM
ncbi:hypothetical protein OEZ85_008768 [Tetradesmus obliquus]|uniref:RRM domain-containing protein n=1 Tax=Tetradesmus obliquus TaxID=3088 RepID=A0ABY8TLR6_TETOB|nr:hypothetical protein OEZ85_008768 [Tetradesmus obliquus]